MTSFQATDSSLYTNITCRRRVLTNKNVGENCATLESSETKSLVGLAQQTGMSVLSPQIQQISVFLFVCHNLGSQNLWCWSEGKLHSLYVYSQRMYAEETDPTVI